LPSVFCQGVRQREGPPRCQHLALGFSVFRTMNQIHLCCLEITQCQEFCCGSKGLGQSSTNLCRVHEDLASLKSPTTLPGRHLQGQPWLSGCPNPELSPLRLLHFCVAQGYFRCDNWNPTQTNVSRQGMLICSTK
jgi:hypothetical protein